MNSIKAITRVNKWLEENNIEEDFHSLLKNNPDYLIEICKALNILETY